MNIRSFVLGLVLALSCTISAQANETVNINHADAATLAEVLEGIGIKKAESIIEYREANGPFASANELSAVSGIGASIISNNAEKIVID